MNWFQGSGYVTFGFIRKTSLQMQILLINAVGLLNLAGNNFDWGWLKGDLQLKKIWELPVLESDNSDVKDIDWIKTILSQIVVARFVINSVSFVAYVANIYTILTRDRQNLLIFWMVLSFVKDILLEVAVIIITLILWHNGSITTLLLVEFIGKKAIRLAVSIWKWCTTLNWYMQLRKASKMREFFESIARRSNASVIDTVGRLGRSLDDANLGIAIVRRGKYTSLLSLDELSEESSNRVKFNRACFDLRTSKSLTALITGENYDTNGINDYDPIANDLSVAEKSMKMLNVTAEDVMDARARIQERSYWNERDATAKISEPMEKRMTCFSLRKNKEETEDASRDRQTAGGNEEDDKIDDQEETVDVTDDVALEKEDVIGHSPTEKEKKTDDSETVLPSEEKEEIFTEEREEAADFLLPENEDVASDEVKVHVTSVTSHDFYITSREKKGEAQEVTKIVQCSLSGCERNVNAKACSSLVEEKISTSVSYEHKWTGESDRRRHPCRVETKPASIAINANRKEHSRSSKMLLPTYCRASNINIHARNNEKNSRTKDEKVNRDRKKSKCFISNDVTQEDKPDERRFALKHLEGRSRKQAQTCQGCSEKQPAAWNSKSLAQTAHLSGYEQKLIASNKLSARRTNLKRVQTKSSNEDSLNRQRRLKHVKQTQSPDLRLVEDFESLKKKNYMRFEGRGMMEARTFETFDFILLENERQARNRYLPSSRKLSAEEREAIELRVLKVYNEQTLLEDKKELEAKKKYSSSLNHKRSLKELKVSKTKDSRTYNDVVLFDNKEETETITNDLPTNCKQSIEKLGALAAYSKFISSDCNLIAGRKHDSSRHATSSIYEENVEVPTSTLNLLTADNIPDRPSEAGIMSHLPKARGNASFDLNDHNARHTLVSLNLREVTRNIEWTRHSGGITLTNKSLQGELSENGRFRESQQRDIVDNNTASVLYNAFFSKPEIIMRIFRRAQTNFEESLPNFGTWRRGDFSVEFICRVNNEMNAQDRNSLLDFGFEWITGGRNNRSRSVLLGTNNSHIAEGEDSHDLCIIFIGREELSSESESAIVEDSAEAQRSARFSIESVQATNILVFDVNHRQTDNSAADDLPVQFIISVLRNFGIEMSEEDIRDVSIGQVGEFENANNAINDFPFCTFNMNDIGNDTILRFRNVETLRSTTTTQSGIRSEDEGRSFCGKTSDFSTDQFPGIYSSDESDFNSLYEKTDDRSEPTLHEGSLMEEFSNDTIPPRTSSDSSAHNSPLSRNNGN